MHETYTRSALVSIDDAPLRKAVSWEFKKAYQGYLKVRAELEHHESHVRPAYRRWLSKMFRDRFEALERLHQELMKRSALLQRMIQLFVFEDRSKAAAFDEANEEFENDFENDFDEEPSESDFFDDAENFSGAQDEFHKERGSREDFAEKPRKQTGTLESQLKSYYRKLAQALHPDLAGEPTDLARELWLETQDAYQSRDLAQLELLWTMLTLERRPLAHDVSVASLKNAVKAMTKKWNEVKRTKRRLTKEDPAWGFETKSKAKLRAEVSRDLQMEELRISEAIGEIESELSAFTRSAATRDRRRQKRSRR